MCMCWLSLDALMILYTDSKITHMIPCGSNVGCTFTIELLYSAIRRLTL